MIDSFSDAKAEYVAEHEIGHCLGFNHDKGITDARVHVIMNWEVYEHMKSLEFYEQDALNHVYKRWKSLN